MGHQERIYLSEDVLSARKPGEKRLTLIDTKVRGLQLIVYPSGRKTFFHRRKREYSSRRLRLGEFPGMSVSLARKRAEVLNGQYSRGENPGEERDKLRHEMRLGQLYELWMAEHLRPHRRDSSVANAEQLWRDYIAPTLANRKLSAVSRGIVASLHSSVGLSRPVQANRALEVLSSMCTFALDRQLAPSNWLGVNPCRGVRSFRETPRRRYLTHDELPRFLNALEAEGNPDLRDFFTMLLLTGARRANVQAMKWTDLDLGSGTWTVAAEEAKGGEEMKLVLTEQALDVLERRRVQARELIQMVAARTLTPVPRMTLRESRRWRDNASKAATAEVFVFPGKGKTGHLVEPKAAWRRILDRAGLTDLRIHDLRRTMGAWLAAGGANAFAIQKALGHRSLAATAVYAQLDLTSVRAAMESVGTAMAKVVAAAREDRTTSDAGMAGPTPFPRTGKEGR